MDLLTFLRIIVLVTNCVYCFVPGGDFGASIEAIPKTSFPLQQHAAQANEISVYDPGDGESIGIANIQKDNIFFVLIFIGIYRINEEKNPLV